MITYSIWRENIKRCGRVRIGTYADYNKARIRAGELNEQHRNKFVIFIVRKDKPND